MNVVRAGPRGGAPLVFLHAVGLDLTYWDQQIAAFAASHDVVAYDLPGHGGSPPLAEAPSFTAMATVLADVIEEVAAGPAHVVGVSVGGMIAQALALSRPDLVRSLSLVATLCTFAPPVRDAVRDRARLTRAEGMGALAPMTTERWFPPAFRARRPDVVDRAQKTLRIADPVVFAGMWDMVADLDFEDRLPSIGCPTLVVAGEDDASAPPSAGRRIAELIDGARFVALPETGHLPPLEAPARFNELLRTFLAGDRAS